MKPSGKMLPRILLLALAIGVATNLAAQGRVRFVKAEVLLADYRINEVAADQKYKNKTIIVTGVIKRVADTSNNNDSDDNTGDGSYMIWLGPMPRPEVKEGERKDPEEAGVITCYFTRGKKSDLMKLRTGQAITIKGRCRGNGPALENCVL